MFTGISVYFLMLFLIFWTYCGYPFLLYVFYTLDPKERKNEPISDNMPKIAIIVPCYNEENYVKQKLENLKKLQYDQKKLKVYFLHGTSTDNTSREIAKYICDKPNWYLIETGCKGKITQINHGLSKISKDVDIIVSTDMDAIISPDVLVKFVNEFNSDNRVAVVGANISPKNSISIEEDYWRNQNILRIIEGKVYTSSIVVAPCYGFRASLMDKFPEDCVADDIYTAFKANTEGYIVKYIESAGGIELRCPMSFSDFFRHKFRKGNAFLIEALRFLYLLSSMSGLWKVIFLTKVLQLAVIPWVLPYFLLSTISMILSGWGLFQVAVFGLLFLFITFVSTSFFMRRLRSKFQYDPTSKQSPILLTFAITNLIMILVGLSFPFYRQTDSYKKIE